MICQTNWLQEVDKLSTQPKDGYSYAQELKSEVVYAGVEAGN